MKLQAQKTELETRRDQQRAAVSANPNDRRAADALRQTEGELATVNAQLIYGPGAKGAVGAAIGRASIAAKRNPQRAADLPTPAPIPTAAPERARSSFVSETDVPWPLSANTAADETRRQNGRRADVQPAAPPQARPQTPANVPNDTPAAPPVAVFQSAADVPYPLEQRSAAAQIVRSNGRR